MIGYAAAPRYREAIWRLTGDEEIVPPGLVLEDDRVEWSWLKRESRFATQPQAAGPIAAQFSFIQVFNPAGSNRIVTLFRYFANAGVQRSINLGLTTTQRGATGAFFAINTDTRWGIATPLSIATHDPITCTFGTAAALGTDVQLASDTTPALGVGEMRFPIVTLAPGTGAVIADSVVNEAINAVFYGYSRVATPEELGA